ncbi:MAG: hypothetical protein ACT6XY_15175 [Phreatobacter sp.]|jgi:hypothetical protein|uniref:hypothetical protein n=1 Tax=Phreatobacter sp. TaxID=1966341 RepID=UPI0040352EE3
MENIGGAAYPENIGAIFRSDFYISLAKNLPPLGTVEGLLDIELESDIRLNWAIRDQGHRPTCIAFAAMACVELFHIRHRQPQVVETLSPAYSYWRMRQDFPINDKKPKGYDSGGTLFRQARDVVLRYGSCLEVKAQYSHAAFGYSGGEYGVQWIYPEDENERKLTLAAADADANLRKNKEAQVVYKHMREGPLTLYPGTSGEKTLSRIFYDFLKDGFPVAIAVPIWKTTDGASNWWTPEAQSYGIVRAPGDPGHTVANGAEPSGGHAVCLVGYRAAQQKGPGHGWFIFRNSSGLAFARDASPAEHGVPAPGYGAISAHYIDTYCWEYLALKN